jgi:hypothetical protein
MYECPICLSLNHNSRLHCQNCGTIPARYSLLRLPARLIENDTFSRFIPVVAAYGCVRSCQHHAARVYLRTVKLDYYAQPSAAE